MRLSRALLTAVALTALATSLIRYATQVASPLEFDFAEGFVVGKAVALNSLERMYPKVDPAVPAINPYPPLFPVATRIVNWVTRDPFMAARLVSSLAGIAIAVMTAMLIYWAVPRRIGSWARASGALVGASLCFLVPAMQLAPHARPDLLAVSLSFAGIFMFLRGGDRAVTDLAAAAFFVAAVFTKQTLVEAPAAVLIAAFVMRPARGVRLGSLMLMLGGSILLFLIYRTDGEIFRHLFVYPNTTFSVRYAVTVMGENLLALAVPASAALWLFAWALRRRSRPGQSVVRGLRTSVRTSRPCALVLVSGLFMVIAFLMGFTVGKEGSNLNYLMPWNLSTAVLAGLAVSLTSNRFPSSERAGALLTAGLLLFTSTACVGAFRGLSAWAGLTSSARSSLDLQVAQSRRLADVIRGIPGDVVSEDMSALVRAGKPILFEPFIVGEQIKMGRFSGRPLVERVEARDFGGLVLNRAFKPQRFTPDFLDAVDRHYVVLEQIGVLSVYVPKPR